MTGPTRSGSAKSPKHPSRTLVLGPESILFLFVEVHLSFFFFVEVQNLVPPPPPQRDTLRHVAGVPGSPGAPACGADIAVGPRCAVLVGHRRRRQARSGARFREVRVVRPQPRLLLQAVGARGRARLQHPLPPARGEECIHEAS